MSNKYWIVYVVIFVIILAIIGFLLTKSTPPAVQSENNPISPTPDTTVLATPEPTPMITSQPTTMDINPQKTNLVTLTTDFGDITIELDVKNTPKTANNFAHLAKTGFYNKTIFHRIINGFMIQGGDPKGTGTGGPGYQFDDEYLQGKYTRGTVAMANSGPNTNGSQFFIMHQDNALPNNYVIFGHVTAGMEVVDKIATAPVMSSGMGENSKPVSPTSIISASFTLK